MNAAIQKESSFRRNFLFDFEEGERKFNPESDFLFKNKSDFGFIFLSSKRPKRKMLRNDTLCERTEPYAIALPARGHQDAKGVGCSSAWGIGFNGWETWIVKTGFGPVFILGEPRTSGRWPSAPNAFGVWSNQMVRKPFFSH